MFTCPEKDIHSLYIDGELPEKFARDYESHIESCEKCRKELEKLRAMHKIFADDAALLDLDKKFMNKSYEQLKGKMRFNYVVKMSEPSKYKLSLKKTFVPMAAAAAAVFAIMLPARMNSTKAMAAQETALPVVSQVQDLNSIIAPEVLVEGGIQNVALQMETPVLTTRPVEIKSFSNEVAKTAKTEEAEDGMKLRLTELSNINSIQAENVSFERVYSLDFIK